MATSKSYFARQNYRFLTSDHAPFTHDSSSFELDEADIYSSHPDATRSDSPEFRKQLPSSRPSKKSAAVNGSAANQCGGKPSSLPVSIPDWSKILKEEYRDSRRRDLCDVDDDDDDADGEDYFDGGRGARIPPHELLARTRIASFSVHEGVGRTLKGRDLSRVRNAIWEKIGFED